jgi:hypothetical protein
LSHPAMPKNRQSLRSYNGRTTDNAQQMQESARELQLSVRGW